MPEIRMSGTRRKDKIVVRDLPIADIHGFRRDINGLHFRKNYFRVREVTQNSADRRRDVSRRKRRGRDLVYERLKMVMIGPVDNSHAYGFLAELFGSFESAKARPHDHDMRQD